MEDSTASFVKLFMKTISQCPYKKFIQYLPLSEESEVLVYFS